LDDNGGSVYFEEKKATDNNWKYLKDLRKEKLKKLIFSHK
jgi:hypothetical protein